MSDFGHVTRPWSQNMINFSFINQEMYFGQFSQQSDQNLLKITPKLIFHANSHTPMH